MAAEILTLFFNDFYGILFELEQPTMSIFYLRVTLVVYLFFSCVTIFAQISHLELGAGNHSHFSDRESPLRFQYLESVVERLVLKYGTTGVVYLNDIAEDALADAGLYLKSYVEKKGYRIEINLIPGDYRFQNFPNVETANMGNPGNDQLPSSYDEKYDGGVANKAIVNTLLRIAGLSRTGLTVSTHMREGINILKQLLGPESSTTEEGSGVEYRWPNGQSYNDRYGNNPVFKVYRIATMKNSCSLLFY